MYILNGPKKEIVDSSFVERFCIVEKPDAVLIVASYSHDRALTLTKYADLPEARSALEDLLGALAGGSTYYEFPESRLFYEGNVTRDARTRRRGGS